MEEKNKFLVSVFGTFSSFSNFDFFINFRGRAVDSCRNIEKPLLAYFLS
jgi:hypothetical protein